MKWSLEAVSVAVILAAALSPAADPPSSLAEKKEAWQQALDRGTRFSMSDSGVMFSLAEYSGDCNVHMVYDPKQGSRLTFHFERDGKNILTLSGHAGSVFRTVKDVQYFAHYGSNSSGCMVAAYDLTTGNKLWETNLKAIGTVAHSAYSNRVAMGLSGLPDLDNEGGGIVAITGLESFGSYVEILDRASGTILANKAYRQGPGSPK